MCYTLQDPVAGSITIDGMNIAEKLGPAMTNFRLFGPKPKPRTPNTKPEP